MARKSKTRRSDGIKLPPGLSNKLPNLAKRQTPKKFTKTEKQVLDILIRNRRKRK